jgi:hypothetical protein
MNSKYICCHLIPAKNPDTIPENKQLTYEQFINILKNYPI